MEANKIKKGEWFCAIEGIAIAEKIHTFYYEEFDDIPEGRKLGDYNLSMVEYKLFCDFDGLPIKRNRHKIFRADWCSPISAKYVEILDKNPKEYASFVKLLKTRKEFKSWETVTFPLTEDNKLKVVQDMENIRKTLPSKFTFEDVLKISVANNCVIDLSSHLTGANFSPLYLRVILGYTYGDFVGKRILFHKFDYKLYERQ